MASEPRNYPFYVFVAYDEDFSAQTYDIAVSLEPGNLVGRPVKYIRHDLNTLPAPAATDTGLEAVLLPGWPKLCEFSQAEELLAAERARAAEKERLRFEGDLDKWMKIIGAGITGYQPEAYTLMDLACEELVKLRADNAAKDARIKELEADRDHQSKLSNKLNRSHAALEAKLAAAHEALEFYADVSKYPAPFTGGFGELYYDCGEKARAVLGGKPS